MRHFINLFETISRDRIIDMIAKIGKRHSFDSGNCAKFAVALRRVLGDGEIIIADGDHYEFADHVALRYNGVIYDGTGAISEEEMESWLDGEGTIEEFYGSDEEILRLADDSNSMAAPLDVDGLAEEMNEILRGQESTDLD